MTYAEVQRKLKEAFPDYKYITGEKRWSTDTLNKAYYLIFFTSTQEWRPSLTRTMPGKPTLTISLTDDQGGYTQLPVITKIKTIREMAQEEVFREIKKYLKITGDLSDNTLQITLQWDDTQLDEVKLTIPNK